MFPVLVRYEFFRCREKFSLLIEDDCGVGCPGCGVGDSVEHNMRVVKALLEYREKGAVPGLSFYEMPLDSSGLCPKWLMELRRMPTSRWFAISLQ